MSIESWREEFYPVSANDKSLTEADSPLPALEHSKRKWEGLRDENLKKHGLVRNRYGIEDKTYRWFSVDASTCALCHRYRDEEDCLQCHQCPLFHVRGMRCDESPTDKQFSPFHIYADPYSSGERDPEPMIKLIDAAIEQVKAAENRQQQEPKGGDDLATS